MHLSIPDFGIRRPGRAFALAALLAGGMAVAGAATPSRPAASVADTKRATAPGSEPRSPDGRRYRAQPLVTEIYAADPAAHVFNGRIYVYPSHDVDAGIADDDLGTQDAMHD